MKNLMKGTLLGVATLVLVLFPAAAMDAAKGTCTEQVGSNKITYDCNFVAHGYEMQTPLMLQLDYACAGRCGGVLAFGLHGPGYVPKGKVEGHIMSVKRSAGSVTFGLMFDRLHESASDNGNANGTAFMSMVVNVDDGSGRMRPTTLPFKVHVNSNGGGAGSH